MSASLKGRTEYDFSFFRSRNHLTLYSMTLGLLDVLKPHIFRPEHRESLHEALRCYFDMLVAYFARKDSFVGVIDKFFIFLGDYLEAEPVVATEFIQAHGSGLLPEMQRALPNMSSLRALVSCLHLDSATPLPPSSSSSSSSAAPPISGYTQQALRDATAEVARLSAALHASKTNEETVAALKEANEACQGGAGGRDELEATIIMC